MQIFRKIAFNLDKTSNFKNALTGKRFNSATRNSGFREIFVQIFYWSKKISRFIMQIFRKIASNIGDFTRFQDFSNLTKHQILKLLSRANGSTQLHETQDSERYLSKYFTGQNKFQSLLCRFYIKLRQTLAILHVFKIFQSCQNIKFSNFCHGQMVQLSYTKLRIQRDICLNILLVKKIFKGYYADFP